MVRYARVLAVLIPVLFFPSTPAYSCGESMFRLGFGVTLPTGPVLNPARIAIYKASKVDPDVFYNDSKVSKKLDKTGHRVTLLEGGEVPAATEEFDIVIARENELASAKTALGPHVAKAVFVPVHEAFAKDDGNELSLPANATLRQILGVLQQAMQAAIA